MSRYRCPSCDREIAAAPHCPHCGAEQGRWAEELAQIERSIAEMKARETALLKEQSSIAAKLQAAVFQRDILTDANQRKLKQATRTRRHLRRPGQHPPPAPPHIPRQPPPRPGGDHRPPPTEKPPDPDRRPPARPEASAREVQNVFLGLGALLLGVAAAVYAAVADDVTRVVILAAATALMLGAPPLVARRGLTATAETIAAVGLLLVALDGYALWTLDPVRAGPLSGAVFAGLTFLVTAAVAETHAQLTRLTAPRYATVLALQPVLPLLLYDRIAGPAGWALALAAVAALDFYLGRRLADRGRLLLPRWLPVNAPHHTGPIRPKVPPPRSGAAGRPETAAEETDISLDGEPIPAEESSPSAFWLREVTWILHGLAVTAALIYATVALVNADTVPEAARAGAVLLLSSVLGLAGAWTVRRPPLPDLAAGILTLSVIGAAGRVAAVALPGRALLLIAAIIALTGAGVRAVPPAARRGPQLASAVALVVIGVTVAGSAIRAALAPIQAAMPVWDADLFSYPRQLAAAAGSTNWQLAVTALLLTIAAVLSLPPEFRREFAVAGAALTALAVPASFGLPWWAAPWPPVLAAIGIGVVGLSAATARAAHTHGVGAAVVGIAGAGAAVARPGLTAAVLITLTAAGILITLAAAVGAARPGPAAEILSTWSAGGAAFALPGAVAAAVAAAVLPTLPLDRDPTPAALQAATMPVLAASFLTACLTLGYTSIAQVSQRQISLPLLLGTGFGAIAVAIAAFSAAGATAADAWVAALVMIAAVLLFLTPTINSNRRANWLLDGADIAAAAAIAAFVSALARIAAALAPDAELAASAAVTLLLAAGVRALHPDWRRGPILGMAVSGGVIALIAGTTALKGGLQALATPGRLWFANLDDWSIGVAAADAWQAPVALVLLAIAAAIMLPRPWAYDVAGVFVGLATVGTPAALGLPWWSPIVVGSAVATGYAFTAVAATDPRASLARASVAAAVALHAVGTSLVRPGTTAAALGLVALVGIVVAALARLFATLPNGLPPDPARTPHPDLMPPHLALIGGTAAGSALLALPGAVAALAAALGWPPPTVLTAALAASSLSVALLGLARPHIPHYLPYATVGIAGGATVTAVASLFTDLPTGVYAAAAVLLGLLAELLRAATVPPGAAGLLPPRSADAARGLARPLQGGWPVSPAVGAGVAIALPTALAVTALAPTLLAALVVPYQTLRDVWNGPPAALASPPAEIANPTNMAAALLLTIAAALGVTGFNRRGSAQAIPVILPGAALTLLIAPISLGLPWPASTLAALGVFTISMLGLALTPPPRTAARSRPVRVARVVVFVIGLAGGGAGLAGSLATAQLTLLTLGGGVAVGMVAALAGRTSHARILGWLFASAMAHSFVLAAGLELDIRPEWSAFGVLAVGAALLLLAAALPRLRNPEALRETATVEWSGYAAALVALALAHDSPRHIAGLLAAWGAVLGVAALRPGRHLNQWRLLFWAAVSCEVSAWWLMMYLADVTLPEAYTLPFAALALLVGLLELHRRPDLNSWVAYGPALVAALLPTLVIVVTTDTSNLRQVLLLLGAVATLIFGSMRRQQAPVVIGAVATAAVALHALTLVGPWLVLIPVGLALLALGASNERRRRTQERLRTLREMR
ncbi:MAG TPA: permease [Micromonosporaceae bacterium]|nr:permease [Micromonosporaceae bacterium]